MSNNFLVRQILKAGGSFFVGASIAIGTLSPIVLTSPPALADDTSENIPTQAPYQFNTAVSTIIKTIAYTPDAGSVILYGRNSYKQNNIPLEALNALDTLSKQNSTINTIAFTPAGEWVIIFDGNGYYPSANFPQEALNEIQYLNKQGSTINTVAFNPNGAFVIIYNGDGYYISDSNPQLLIDRIVDLNKKGETIKTIAFTPDGGWVILYNRNYAFWNNIPQEAINEITKAYNANYSLTNIVFSLTEGWLIFDKSDNIPDSQKLFEAEQALKLTGSVSQPAR